MRRGAAKSAVVTGAAGFIGYHLVQKLLQEDYLVHAVVRPGSKHNERLSKHENLRLYEISQAEYGRMAEIVGETAEVFFHLAWQAGSRDDFALHHTNMEAVLTALRAAKALSCRRFLAVGSQAEYGPTEGTITEETALHPVNAYGAAKVAACYLTQRLAAQLGVEWLWGRIFSIYGKYENEGHLLRELVAALSDGREFSMTAARQTWDFLYAEDCAAALIALAEKGRVGEVYNIADGRCRPLREFTEEARRIVASDGVIHYGERGEAVYGIAPSVKKLQEDTGWHPQTAFEDGIRKGYEF
ncbi:NAD(P)-dependent oxidoreductase [Selenomonas sputigena]|uniref:NAD(P)-dependent oxidoreductase n=1 Tax=Selenomonas sputigena TaxID=69823 RepID=A0ABV3X1Q0_9FIRM